MSFSTSRTLLDIIERHKYVEGFKTGEKYILQEGSKNSSNTYNDAAAADKIYFFLTIKP